MLSFLALHLIAARRGDGLRPELVEALARQVLIDGYSLHLDVAQHHSTRCGVTASSVKSTTNKIAEGVAAMANVATKTVTKR
ncbi:hypothetical protein [Rhizobium mesoamericanum]|uniref:hypothetical protein n=1 Tax=Rhizobium mesoamericanum TaxID=1079800 RepID=UPI0012DC786E|nr:hypothetical protein [Rhizobium mesoamericanum]